MINIAIIGSGNVAKNFHLPAWKKIKTAKVIALVDKNLEKAKKLAKSYKIKSVYSDIKMLLKNENIHAVDICTPNHRHDKDILISLKNNKHVICEKPFILNLKNFYKIEKLSKEKKLVCVSALHQRFRQPSITSKKLIEQDKLGKIYSAHITAIFNRSNAVKNQYFTQRNTFGGPMIDLGSHFIDLAWWMMGRPKPISIFKYTSNQLAKYLEKKGRASWKKFNVEDYVFGGIRFQNRKFITFQMSYLLNTQKNIKKIEFYGTKGGLLWPEVKLTSIKNKSIKSKSFFYPEKTPASILELKHFVSSIQKKLKQKPTLTESKFMVKVINAFNKSRSLDREIFL